MDTTVKRTAEESASDESIKKQKLETPESKPADEREKGIAYIKAEYRITARQSKPEAESAEPVEEKKDDRDDDSKGKRGKKKRGQNKNRDNRQDHEEVRLCVSLINPFEGKTCHFGPDACRFTHDVKAYVATKPKDIEGVCPVFEALGYCPVGFKCRFLHSHFNDEKFELVRDLEKYEKVKLVNFEINHATGAEKYELVKKKFEFVKAKEINKIIDEIQSKNKEIDEANKKSNQPTDESGEAKSNEVKEAYNVYHDAKYYASEKKKLDLHHKKIVSPLTTVGNLPYRRLMRHLGADVTYSEMALTQPLFEGKNSEWALPKAHASEMPGFGIQIATSKPWQASQAVEALAKYAPNCSEINLNSGCPIDLLYRQGMGAGLMEQPPKIIRILNSMNYCSGDIPTTLKIRMGCADKNPTAHKLVTRVLRETQTAAITLHGRSRQQRYTREADWSYISEVGKVIRETEAELEEDKDRRDFQRVQFVGNGDVFHFEDYYNAIADENIDSVMVARGALIKPWIFEEIEAQQHLDKSATERLEIIEKYSKYALEHWGSDEFGINTARRFLCEFMSFFHRYTPYGVLEHYPIKLNQRPQYWKGRNDLETLLGSDDYRDWIKVSEMFLGPASETFKFVPKHKSNSYDKAEY
ncbi:hypothetical protein WICPIJ_005276 [Wickerhamomyces pijperi]|uniref:tRNA-dihydrouridine(47) synthase [NAD(P)(+)] n=1 Tax=Wickerhamomyces pijperi TaxID=599730 RepID=A0A9P8Q630_WICPI|nr:hypothetical protein WICPIJ_005276 [Wickerhamomyces pijperi]